MEFSEIVRYPRGKHPTTRTMREKIGCKAGTIFVRRALFS
jgi:hypothetical protein